MNPLNVIRGFDPDLYKFFENELEHQNLSLSFIPDQNATSPLCAAIMGSVLVNSTSNTAFIRNVGLEALTADRICKLFNAEHANIKTITIEAASRVVFQSLTKRGDVVMSLDLRKKEHCNSENLAYRFVNFGIDSKTHRLDYDGIEKQALACNPQLIVLSPINYPLNVDYERLAKIAKACNALLWCDISQTAGLIAGGAMNSPLPYADVVTFTAHGAMQGPLSSVILCKQEIAGAIDRMVLTSGHNGLQTAHMAALAARVKEMQEPSFKEYAKAVVENAKALAEGFIQGGLKLVCDTTETHLVMVDTRNCAVSARGAQEILADVGINVRICAALTADPTVKYDAVRFSTLSATTRGIQAKELTALGVEIAKFLLRPDEAQTKALKDKVTKIAYALPPFSSKWLSPVVLENLKALVPARTMSDSSFGHKSKIKILKNKN